MKLCKEKTRTSINPLLTARNICISYDRIQAAWDISFDVMEGSITALVGSNGAGKTAIMKTLSGILAHSRGTLSFDKNIIDDIPAHRRVELGISLIPEGRKIFPDLTVKENLEIGAYGKRARSSLSENIAEIYRLFPALKARKKQPASSLSGGEQQMLAIGRGLMACPRLLMLDEPSLGLAPLMVKLVFETVEMINRKGVTILLVEQNVQQALSIADKAYVLESGNITIEGTGSALLEDPHVKTAYLGL